MITNEWIRGNENLDEPMQIRRAVFVEEQGVPEDHERDADDAQALHLLIRDGQCPVACGRIWHDGKTFRIGRCAVLKDARGQGIGDLLVKLLLRKAFEYADTSVCIHAQTAAKGFYERYGFRPVGGEFLEEGIPHLTMCVSKEALVFPSKCGSLGECEQSADGNASC